MRKYSKKLLKAFIELTQESGNNTARKGIVPGFALPIKAEIISSFKNEGGSWIVNGPLLSDIVASLQELGELGWIEKVVPVNEEERRWWEDYGKFILKAIGEFTPDIQKLKEIFIKFPSPLNGTWFRLTSRGEEFAKKIENWERLTPEIEEKIASAWSAFFSGLPHSLSQAANSMVEALEGMLKKVGDYKVLLCKTSFGDNEKEWMEKMLSEVSTTKSLLNRVKHYKGRYSQELGEILLGISEQLIYLLNLLAITKEKQRNVFEKTIRQESNEK